MAESESRDALIEIELYEEISILSASRNHTPVRYCCLSSLSTKRYCVVIAHHYQAENYSPDMLAKLRRDQDFHYTEVLQDGLKDGFESLIFFSTLEEAIAEFEASFEE